MQLIVYLLSKTIGNSLHCRQIVYGSISNATNASETCQKPLSSFCSDSLDFFQT